jgi:hypothetical protein
VATGVGGGRGGATIIGDRELAGVAQSGATVHCFQNGEYRGEVEKKARPCRGKS